MKQRNNYKKDVQVWKENYENYIHRIIKRIKEWQKSDIKYLNSVYPNMDTLFKNTAEIHSSIFSRSQNDKDFMVISLGMSDEVKPLFEIKARKKIISFMIYTTKNWRQNRNNPSIKKEKRRKKLSPAKGRKKTKTDFAYGFGI